MKELEYTFDSSWILKNRKKIRRALLENQQRRIKKRIAILGGSTTNDVTAMLELFLLNNGIEPEFYQSEYNRYWQDAVFGNPELNEFKPELIYIHTTSRNITEYTFDMKLSEADVSSALERQYEHFIHMWQSIEKSFGCPVIQNNFEMPLYRIMGNSDASDFHGRVNFISSLNTKFYEYAQSHRDFYINDINYISACFGLEKWLEPSYWYMYKYAMNLEAIPELAFNIANIIKSVFGKNKKLLALDLDNTLWGGVIGDDGLEGIEIGKENAEAESYDEFQRYVKEHKKLGVILAVCSKNDYENAVMGLEHPESVLSPDDFISIMANWESKDRNIAAIAEELSILPESIVFADDNPAERHIVSEQLGVAAPELTSPESYIRTLDRNGYFEVTSFSEDDLKRNDMYRENIQRERQRQSFENYEDYLLSLDMHAVIEDFRPVFLQRITQLTNKSNQFNLTTKRYTISEMEALSEDNRYIRLYGRLKDRFGDNGIVSVVIGEKRKDTLHIELWLMSCRVLKRDMELAMLDSLVKRCREEGIRYIRGYYFKTQKNAMVKELYGDFGFIKTEDNGSDTQWLLDTEDYENKNKVIKMD